MERASAACVKATSHHTSKGDAHNHDFNVLWLLKHSKVVAAISQEWCRVEWEENNEPNINEIQANAKQRNSELAKPKRISNVCVCVRADSETESIYKF